MCNYYFKTNDAYEHIVLFFLCFFFCHTGINAQCDPPNQLPTVSCWDAPLSCLQDACFSTSYESDEGQEGFCGGNTGIHNPQYFEILTTATEIEIHIHVDSCAPGSSGLQSAIVTGCHWMPCQNFTPPCEFILDCDPGTGVGGTMELSASGLFIGTSLWLLIDGSSGALCQYTITLAEGIYEAQIEGEITGGEAVPEIVCQGYDELIMTASPPIENAHGYLWELGWSGEIVTSTFPFKPITIPNDAPAGLWEVCVQAFSGCDTSEIPFCFPVEIYEVADVEKQPETFCPEEFPFSWQGITIAGPGIYTQTFDDPEGCAYDTIWEIDVFPDGVIGESDHLGCLNENLEPYLYEGIPYSSAGTYDLFYPNAGLYGCDSMAQLHLVLAGMKAHIDLTCADGEFILAPIITELIPFNANITWSWYYNGDQVYNDIPLILQEGGIVELYATIQTPIGNCTVLVSGNAFVLDEEQYLPVAPNLGFLYTTVCEEDEIFFTIIEDPMGEYLEYTWSAPPDVPVFQDGSNIVEMDFSNSAGGEVCVFASGACGIGPVTCFNVEIQPEPVATLAHETTVCSDSSTIITFTGSASSNAQFEWDFDNPFTLTGNGSGPYIVTWNSPGDKIVSLYIIEPGCDTVYNSDTITVTRLLAPDINCSSTMTSVEFDWNDVPGSDGYLVSINGSPAVTIPNSNYSITGLTPGTVVELTLTVVGTDSCGNITLTSSCTAQDCPPAVLNLSGPDSLCLNTPVVINLVAEVNGFPGTGVWTGPGIVDGNTGTFDPGVSGPGEKHVTYTVEISGCQYYSSYLITVFDSIKADFNIDPEMCISDEVSLTFTGNASASAVFDFDFGSATVVSGSGAGPYQLSFNSPGTKVISLHVNENGCTSETVSQTLQVSPNLEAPVVNCLTGLSEIIFSWTNNNPGGYLVNVLSGQTGILALPVYEFTGLLPDEIVELEIISLSSGPCPERRDTFACIARACPMPLFAITPVADVCLYPGTSPIDLEIVISGGNGSGDWAGSGITEPVNGIFDPVIAGAGTHVITFHYLDDGCDFFESDTINVFDAPVAFISNTNPVLTCATGNGLLLDGSSSTGGDLSFEWSTDTGFIISGLNLHTALIGKPGSYQLKVIDGVSGCVDSTTVMVAQDAYAPVADAGSDKVINCNDLSFFVGGDSSQGTNIVYAWSTQNGNIIGAANGGTVTIDKPGDYTITVLDTTNGCQALDTVTVTIDTITGELSLFVSDTIDCNTPLVSVTSSLSLNPGDYDFVWSTLDGAIEGDPVSQHVHVSQGGYYSLTITNKNNGCTETKTAFVSESSEIINAVDVSQTNINCFGDANGTLTINSVTGGTPPYIFQWSVNSIAPNLSSLTPGQYTLTVTDHNGCDFIRLFTITEPQEVTADIGPNIIVTYGDSVTINLLTNLNKDAINTIDWSGLNAVNCSGCPSLKFVASTNGTVLAIVTDTAGCTAIDSMKLTVMVSRNIYLPDVFSPNGDGINDYFYIAGSFPLLNVVYLKIYDRWGNNVFYMTDLTPGEETEGWDGKYKGQLLHPGVYVFVAELEYVDGYSETVKGDITIIR